jgi:putative transcriptional regulator
MAEGRVGASPAAGTGGPSGARVRSRRREVGLTQQELAARVGVSRQTIISMETGDYAPSVYLAIRVGRELGVTVEELWG